MSDAITEGEPLLTAIVCWECRVFLVETNRYSSHGPYCARCRERMETFKVRG